MNKGLRQRAAAPKKLLTPKRVSSSLNVPTSVARRLHNPNPTDQELKVLLRFLESGNDKKVAAELHRSQHTVRNQLAIIEWKLGVRGRCELLLYFWNLRATLNGAFPPDFSEIARSRAPNLTDREMAVLLPFLEIGNDMRVATHLNISEHTVRHHRASIQSKMNVAGPEELLLFFWKMLAEPNRPS